MPGPTFFALQEYGRKHGFTEIVTSVQPLYMAYAQRDHTVASELCDCSCHCELHMHKDNNHASY